MIAVSVSIALSEQHRHTAALMATVCREVSGAIRRPAILIRDKLAISVGCGEGVNFYEVDGNIYLAIFSVDARGEICWRHNDFNLNVLALEDKIDKFFRLLPKTKHHNHTNPFVHWCSVCCWREHVYGGSV